MPRPAPSPHTATRLIAAVRLIASTGTLAGAGAGIPYVLLTAVGVPWPSQIISLNDLLTRLGQPISDPFVLQALALVGWACWAYFTATVLREALWLLRRLPTLMRDTALLRRRTATLPAHRAAVALLVGTLLIALIGLWRLPVAHATAPAMSPAAGPVAAVAPLQVPPARADKAQPATYVVQPGDTLWGIAEQHLGDPLHWPKIYQLSCAIRQSDGELLSDPDHIQPGWRLHLPVHNAPAPRPPQPPAKPQPSTPTPAPEPHVSQPPGRGARGDEQRHTDRQQHDHHQAQEDRPVAIGLGTASTIGVTTAAGIAAAIGFARWHATRRRTPRLDAPSEPLEDDDLLLGEALHRSNQAHLASRATRHHNPDVMARRTAPAEAEPPGMVTIAERAGREVSIDALTAPGGVHLAGPGAEDAARHLLIAIASAAQRLRPAPPRVQLLAHVATVHRLLPGIDTPLPAWTLTGNAAEASQAAEHALLEHARHEQSLDTEALEQDAPAFHILFLDGGSPGEDEGRLRALTARAGAGQLAVVTLGGQRDVTQHQLAIAADGTSTGPLAALDGATMFLLTPDTGHELAQGLLAAHGHHTAPHAPTDPTGLDPDPVPLEAIDVPAPEPAGAPAPQCPHDPRPSRQSLAPPAVLKAGPPRPVHLALLGGFKLLVHDEECTLADTRKEETREFIALLAAHQSGLRGEEIAEKMQLADDPSEMKAELENLRRAARRVFRSATGKKEVAFVTLSGPIHRLDPQYISTDVTAFTDALTQATRADSPYERATALQHATTLYTGQLCEGADYLWAQGLRTALHRRALDALMLLAEHTAQHSADPEPALALLNQAADLDPENERVYRRIIQLQITLGRDDAAHRTLTLLTDRLASIDEAPEAATLALLNQAPPLRRAPAGGTPTRR
ncbi:BTAD domain-containing putative transcriptional regulator [Streptomyces sp. NPDC056240]|uniref:BTAD domain-containing putative transcriptional regulator n=1 Tax=Streptomyces sp. NPDC056240 TaxID=3345759 RepID=UPI0035DE37EE